MSPPLPTPEDPTLADASNHFLGVSKEAPVDNALADAADYFSSKPTNQAKVGSYWTPEKVNRAVNHLQRKAKLSPMGAMGLVSRWAGVEAGDGPDSVNPKSGAVGIGQWLGGREIGMPKTLEGQLDHVAKELNGKEALAAKVLRSAKTPEEAAIGAAVYERAEGYDKKNPMAGDKWVQKTIDTIKKLNGVTTPQDVRSPVDVAQADPLDVASNYFEQKGGSTPTFAKPTPGTLPSPNIPEEPGNPVYGMSPEQLKSWESGKPESKVETKTINMRDKGVRKALAAQAADPEAAKVTQPAGSASNVEVYRETPKATATPEQALTDALTSLGVPSGEIQTGIEKLKSDGSPLLTSNPTGKNELILTAGDLNYFRSLHKVDQDELQAQRMANPSILDTEAQARSEIENSTPTDRILRENGLPTWLAHIAPGSRIIDDLLTSAGEKTGLLEKKPATEAEIANRMEEIAKEREPLSIDEARSAVAKGHMITDFMKMGGGGLIGGLYPHYTTGALGGAIGEVGRNFEDISGAVKFVPGVDWLLGGVGTEAGRVGQGLRNIQQVTKDGDNGLAMTFAQLFGSLPVFANRIAVMRGLGGGNAAVFAVDSALPEISKGNYAAAVPAGVQGYATGNLLDIAPAADRAMESFLNSKTFTKFGDEAIDTATGELKTALSNPAGRELLRNKILGGLTELGTVSLGSGAITYSVTGDKKQALDSIIQMGGLHALNMMGPKFPRIMQFKIGDKVETVEVKPSEDGNTATVSEVKNDVPPEFVDTRVTNIEEKPTKKKQKDKKVVETPEAPLPVESPYKTDTRVVTPDGNGVALTDHVMADGTVPVQLDGEKGISMFKPEVLKAEEAAPREQVERGTDRRSYAATEDYTGNERRSADRREEARVLANTTPETVHNLALDKFKTGQGLDPESPEFKAESKRLTGKENLDDMSTEELATISNAIDTGEIKPAEQPATADPEAVSRKNVEPDGKVWQRGQVVDPTNEVTADLIRAAEEGQQSREETLAKLKQAKKDLGDKPDGLEINKAIARIVGSDHRYGTDIDKAISAYKGERPGNAQYIADIKAANDRYNRLNPVEASSDSLETPEQPIAETSNESTKATAPGEGGNDLSVKGIEPGHDVTITDSSDTSFKGQVTQVRDGTVMGYKYKKDGTLGKSPFTAQQSVYKIEHTESKPTAEPATEPTQVAPDVVENVAAPSADFNDGDPVYLDGKTPADVSGTPYENKKGELMVPLRTANGDELVVKASRLRMDEAGFASMDLLTHPVQGIVKAIRAIHEAVTGPIGRLSRAGVGLPAIVHAYARISTPFQVNDLLSQVFPDSYMNPEKMAETAHILNLDQILDGYYTFRQRSQDALQTAAGFTRRQTDERAKSMAESVKWQQKADAVNAAHPIKDVISTLLDARNNPEIVANIERYNEFVAPKLESLFKNVKGLAEDEDLPQRGHFFKARLNLLPDFREEEMKSFGDLGRPQPGSSYTNYKNPLGARDQYDRAASFTGNYSTDMQAILTNVLGPRLNIASRLNLFQSLIDTGNGVYGDKPDQINGRDPVPLDIRLPESSGPQNRTKLQFERMWVDPKLYAPLRQVLNTDMRAQQIKLAKYINAFQVMQLVDLVAHLKNVHTVLAYAPKTGSELANAVLRLPGVGTVDTLRRINQTINDVASNTPEVRAKMAEMATNGMLRPEYPAKGVAKYLPGPKLIHQVDTASRMIMADFFDKQVEAGNVDLQGAPGTPEYENSRMLAKRNFVQQIGEYNDRLMTKRMSTLKGWGLSPFVVAGTTFNKMAVKMLTGDPGFKASSTTKAAQLRAVNILSGPVMAAVVPAMLNLASTGSLSGRPGTPIGAWDYGSAEDDKGKHEVFDIMQLLGYRRGLRLTGLNSLMAGLQAGAGRQEIIDNMIEDSKNTLSHPWIGPALGFAFRVASGEKLDLRGGEDWQGPRNIAGQSKYIDRLRVAVRDTNPFVYSIAATIPGVNNYTSTPSEREPLNLKFPGTDTNIPDPIAKVISGLGKAPAASAGFTLAKTPATKLMDDMAAAKGSVEVDPTNEASRAEAQRLLTAARTGTPDKDVQTQLEAAVNNGTLKLSQVAKLQDNLQLAPIAVKFKYMVVDNVPDIIKVWERMTPKEKEQSWPVMLGKVANLINSGKVTESDAVSLKSMGIDENSFSALQQKAGEKQDKAVDKFNAIEDLRQGEQPDLTGMTKAEDKKVITAGNQTQAQTEFESKTPAEQLFIFSNSPEKRKEYYPIFVKSLQTLSKKKGMTPADAEVIKQMATALANYKP